MVVPQTMQECSRWYGVELEQVRAKNLGQWLQSGDGIGITNYDALGEGTQKHSIETNATNDGGSYKYHEYSFWV
jgi:hypothetical protein